VKAITIFLVFILLVPVFNVQGGEETHQERIPSSDTMLFDLLVLRPIGLATCALGLAASIVSVPFDSWSRDPSYVGKRFIEEPFEFTFLRPLGKIDPDGIRSVIRNE
jgi:hypothetical protein